MEPDGLIHIKGIRSPVSPLSHGDRKVIEDASKAEALHILVPCLLMMMALIFQHYRNLIFRLSVIQTVEFNVEEVPYRNF